MVDFAARRETQREALVDCAEAAIAAGGLPALKARDLAACVGCSLGAIYNLVADLDELVLRVSRRTLAALDAELDAIEASGAQETRAQLVAWAKAYAAFATANRNLWRALFDFRMVEGAELPDWFAADQVRLFLRLETRLAALMPGRDDAAVKRQARTLFSAVHGIVALGLERKLVEMPVEAIDAELEGFVAIYLAGLEAAVRHGGSQRGVSPSRPGLSGLS